MPAITLITAPLGEQERNARLYAGEILIFQGFPAVVALVELLRTRCRGHLGSDPQRVHERLNARDLAAAAISLRRETGRDAQIRAAFASALEAIGADGTLTCCDALVTRMQPPRALAAHHRLSPLVPHRDTWGTNVAAQINWWGPIFPAPPDRTIALYPSCFARPVENDSADWDFEELLRRRRADGGRLPYPPLPTATLAPDEREALPISLVPGTLMAFSGAHLHASVPNATELTRLSFETRTVNSVDARAGRGAPNVDGKAPCRTEQLFRHLCDGTLLGPLRRVADI